MKGSVKKHGKTWRYRIYMGVIDGEKSYQSKSGFKTEREAQAAMRKVLTSLDTGTYVPSTSMTVGDFLEKWLEDKASVIRYGTLRKYRWLINRRIIPMLGKLPLQGLTPQHIQTLYAKLRNGDKPLSSRSILHTHRLLHEALDRALKWSLIARNPCDAVETPKADRPQMQAWTPEQARHFLSVAHSNRYYVAFVLALETGMRQGEILGLKWSDIDLQNGYLNVKRADYRGIINEPKTVRGRRGISLLPNTVQVLKTHKACQTEERMFLGSDYCDNELVIAKNDGTPLRARSLENHWYKLLEESGLPRIRFHDLRHTHASMMAAAGVSAKAVSDRLGHSTVSFTLDTYTHLYRDQQDEAAARLQNVLYGTTKTS